MTQFMQGVQAYRQHPFQRDLPPVPVVWSEGTTRLLDYSLPDAQGMPLLVVPSLINRAYVLDLTPRRSFMRHLAAKGFRPFLVDWDSPGDVERDFGLDDYIAGRLSTALDVVMKAAGRPMVIGYCMGGLLGLGVGLLRQEDVLGLVTLATPWDFHQPTPTQGMMVSSLKPMLNDAITLNGRMPIDLLQTFFTMIDPASIERKFRSFAELAPDSARARDFVALEDWLNDGVPLTAKVARECLFGWYADNNARRGLWSVGGHAIRPQEFMKPALVLIPAKDRIVPPASAESLAEALPNARRKNIAAGHIGMVAGARAKAVVYSYLVKWLTNIKSR